MGNLPLHQLYTLLGVFSFISAFSIALFKPKKNKCHWFLVAIHAVWSLRMLIYALLFNPDRCHMIWTWPFYILLSMAYAPLFYLFTIELTDIKGITKKDYIVFLPLAAMTALFLFIYLGMSPSLLQQIHDNVIEHGITTNSQSHIVEYLIYRLARTVTFWFEAGVLLLCCWYMHRYENVVNDYFSSNFGKSVGQSRIISILTGIGAFVVLMREAQPDYAQELNIQKVVLVLITFMYQMALTVMAFIIDYSADDIRNMIEKSDKSNARSMKNILIENRTEVAISKCWMQLEHLMNEEKIFLEPDLNLIDLAQKLGSNRTYLSTAVRQYSGKSFSDYINEARINYAKQLLLLGDSIKNVAYSCGYISSSTFYRQFQKITGDPPLIWLRKKQERE